MLNNGILYTPGSGVLEGVTRGATIDLAKELGIHVSIKNISYKKIITSQEIFATSTAGGIMPITKIDGKKIGGGNFGKVTKKLYKLYWKKHLDPAWSCLVE